MRPDKSHCCKFIDSIYLNMKPNKHIDHTLLKPTATKQEIVQLCNEAIHHHFFSVCVHGCYVKLARKIVENTPVKICCVVGFPLGAMTTKTKVFEAKNALKNGADEIDMVINLGALKNKNFKKVVKDVQEVKKIMPLKTLKVIIETSYLTDEEIVKASELVVIAGADFVKTSTGFGTRGASVKDIELIKKATQETIKIKASGGIKTPQDAKKYLDMGVDRLGTSSGVEIVSGGIGTKEY